MMKNIKTAIQEKHPETGEATGSYSFSRIVGGIVGLVGCGIIIGGLLSQLFHDPVRLAIKDAVTYGGGVIVLAALVYSQKVVGLAVNILQKRFGVSKDENS